MQSPSVYLDHAATTPVDPRVLEAMLPHLKSDYGNPSSPHRLGRKAHAALEMCREQVAHCLGAQPSEIIFTSGGTESDNLALSATLRHNVRHVITSRVEHKAILESAEALRGRGVEVSFVEPDSSGVISSERLLEALRPETGLISLMHVNNEIGCVTPLRDIAAVCQEEGIILHTDAVQSAGLYRIDVDEIGLDMVSISGHKIYGPKGVGVLYVRQGVELAPLLHGGGQEKRRRSGTQNVPAIAGLAKAMGLASEEREARLEHLSSLQDRFRSSLTQACGDRIVFNTPFESTAETAPHIVNFSLLPQNQRDVDGDMLLAHLDRRGVMVSSGSACDTGAVSPSHVLTAIGRPREVANATVRVSLGKDNTEQDVDQAVSAIAASMSALSF